MQWLIDIITERVIATIGIPPVFIKRGDPAVPDFDWEDFIRDEAWHDLDLSGIVPAGASAVCLFNELMDTIIFRYVTFRTKGNINEESVSRARNQIAVFRISNDFTIPLGSDRKIQYKTNLQARQILELTVKGWWL